MGTPPGTPSGPLPGPLPGVDPWDGTLDGTLLGAYVWKGKSSSETLDAESYWICIQRVITFSSLPVSRWTHLGYPMGWVPLPGPLPRGGSLGMTPFGTLFRPLFGEGKRRCVNGCYPYVHQRGYYAHDDTHDYTCDIRGSERGHFRGHDLTSWMDHPPDPRIWWHGIHGVLSDEGYCMVACMLY